MMNRSPSTRAILALLPVVTILLMALIWSIVSGSVLAQEVTPTPLPTVTPWGGRRGVMPGGAAPLFPYWLAGLPVIAALIALIVWRTRRAR
jgi:Na+/proline symporter